MLHMFVVFEHVGFFNISESDADVVVTVRVKKLDKVSFQ